MAMYGASRAALELLTKAWAAEYGPTGVRVNAVAPGPTRTRMMEAVPDEMVNQLAGLAPAGRVAQPEELAAAIVFLASDDASFVHGVTLAVDGRPGRDVTRVGGDVYRSEDLEHRSQRTTKEYQHEYIRNCRIHS